MAEIFFEGTEKKFEIVLKKGAAPLRGLGDRFWYTLVELAGANVLSKLTGSLCNAYLLSESSLFVFDDRAVMITCGQTNLALSLAELVKKIGVDEIQSVLYKRKNPNFPHLQISTFDEDRDYIRVHIPVREHRFNSENGNYINLLCFENGPALQEPAMTCELLMHGIDPRRGRLFVGGYHKTRYDFYRETGMHELLPGFQCDDHFFEPSGYSVNALAGREFYTVHVTPEDPSPYVSFETNRLFTNTRGLRFLLRRMLSFFRPESFDVLLTGNSGVCRGPAMGAAHYRLFGEQTETISTRRDAVYRSYVRSPEQVSVV